MKGKVDPNLPVGSRFVFRGHTMKVIGIDKGCFDQCIECDFYDDDSPIAVSCNECCADLLKNGEIPECYAPNRPDKKKVVFREVKGK